MPQKAVEIILMRRLASTLAIPVLLFDAKANLLYFNEPAGAMVGKSFEETGEMPVEKWHAVFDLVAEDAAPLPDNAGPLVTALKMYRAVHCVFWLRVTEGIRKKLEVTALPLEGQGGRRLGAVVTLWEPKPA